jgi:hypothetical protein
VTGSEVIVQLDPPNEREIQVTRPAGSRYVFSPGDRVAWWPVWDLGRAEGSGWGLPLSLDIQERLVRESDLSAEERADVEAELAHERKNLRVEREYQDLIRGWAIARHQKG